MGALQTTCTQPFPMNVAMREAAIHRRFGFSDVAKMNQISLLRFVATSAAWRCLVAGAGALGLLTGCVSMDGRAWREAPDRAETAAIAGTWQAHAFYRTTGELLGPASIAEALQVPARNADVAEIARTTDGGLSFTFKEHGDALLTQTYAVADGLQRDPSGAFVLPPATNCAGGDLQAGCTRRSVTLFVNAHRELVLVTETDALGIVTILPMIIHAKHVSTFARKTGDADVDNVPLLR